MKHKILVILLAASLWHPLRAQEAPPAPINPALLYWQAAARLPKLSDEQRTELKEMMSGKQPPDEVKIYHSGITQVEDLLRRATASSAPCDWGLLVEEGPFVPLPHLSKMQEMASLAALRGEFLLGAGRTAEGLEWLLMTHRMARHAGAGEYTISLLVQSIHDVVALRVAARHCLGWDEATRRRYADELATLPPRHSLRDGFAGRWSSPNWFANAVQSAEPWSRERLEKFLREVRTVLPSQFLNPDAEAVEKEIQAQLQPEALREAAAECHELKRRALAALGKPWVEGRPEREAILEASSHSAFPLVRMSFCGMAEVQEKFLVADTIRTMLDAALRHGPALDDATAATYHDALEGQPLRLKRAADGSLSLVAAEQHPQGKDIELKLGK